QVAVPGYEPMEVKHILVPTRGGSCTESVQTACEIARIHKAKVTALHVLEIPLTIPLDTAISHRMAMAEAVLKRADAIAREFNVEISMKIVRSRSIVDTIISEVKKGKFDLLVMGAWDPKSGSKERKVGSVVDSILRKAPCRVWVCLGKPI
ncbi:MAG: universal stress protein, partial [Chlamydiota bacterium]